MLGNSHDGEQFQPLDGTEWETLVWLPVTPKPTTIEVSAKAQGARGIGEELGESASLGGLVRG